MADHLRNLNFNAGPATLPQSVLEELQQAIIEYKQSGMSILEIPHRGSLFAEIMEESKALVKSLCLLNEDFEVLWLPGGRTQFAMIPMNFLGDKDTAGYIDSGIWAKEALEYAEYYGNVSILASSAEKNYSFYPEWPSVIPDHLKYLHFTTNNTICGTQTLSIPDTRVPLVADMSSDIFSIQRDFKKFGLFYAVAQKNLGPAGVTLVVVHKELLSKICRRIPPMLNYKAHVDAGSILNTPPVFAIYACLLMLRWTNQQGLKQIEQRNREKADLLYGELERNSIFVPTVDPKSRSLTNVVFQASNSAHEEGFLDFCKQNGVLNIKGHRKAGAFRVSMYNAISVEAVKHLVTLMREYELLAQK